MLYSDNGFLDNATAHPLLNGHRGGVSAALVPVQLPNGMRIVCGSVAEASARFAVHSPQSLGATLHCVLLIDPTWSAAAAASPGTLDH